MSTKLKNHRISSLLILTLFLFSGTLLRAGDTDLPEWKKSYSDKEVRQNFNNPPLFYAPHTFWFWDAPLNPDLCASMAEKMTKQRLNPGYAHPRHSGAPDKPYPSLPVKEWLSPLWFESFGRALDKAEQADMTLGYCDEYWWPSGQAAGRVLQQHPELKAQSLNWERREVQGSQTVQLPESKFTVAAKVSKDGQLISKSLKVIGSGDAFNWKAPQGNWAVFSYNLYFHPGRDMGKVNYLDPKLMDVFIPIAHESYEKNMDGKMGRSIPGVFVDNEGDFGWKMAWSEYLPVRYKEMKNSDIRQWMPLLTEKDEEGLWVKARTDWFDVVSDIYSEQFLGRLNDWLGERNMYYISNLWEESLILQSMAVGDFMRSQRRVSLPGNDCLQMKSQQVHDFKETQSVCEFENKPFMSELMGVAGWEMTPVQMRMTINTVTAWGVTHTVPHGINLNRKLETCPYPPDWFDENPYWRYLHLWTDYARRASYVNRQGKLAADILLYNPLKSVWALSEGYFLSTSGEDWQPYAGEINNIYSQVMNILTKERLDYLIADDYYLSKSHIKDAAGNQKNTALEIAGHSFKVLVLPSIFILPRESAEKILSFAKSGGIVAVLGDLPAGSTEKGARDERIQKQMRELLKQPSVINLAQKDNKMNILPQEICKRIEPQIKFVSGEFPMISAHRKIGKSDYYWLINNTGKRRSSVLSFREGQGRAEIWNCENGGIETVSYKNAGNRKQLSLKFEPYEAYWLVFNAAEEALNKETKHENRNNEIVLSGPWRLSLPESDTVSVSSVRSKITGDTATYAEILRADYDDSGWIWVKNIGPLKLFEEWKADILYNPQPESKRFYRYTFILNDEPEKALLNINGDNLFRFWVNGAAVKSGIYSSTMDKVDVHDITALLHKGENLIAVEETNHVGYGWLLAQGSVQYKNGKVTNILSSSEWLETSKPAENWFKTDFNASSWHKAKLADTDVIGRELRGLTKPQKPGFSKNIIWWRMPVPPGAVEVDLPGLSSKAKIWLDGVRSYPQNGKMSLNDKSRIIVVKNYPGESGLTSAAVFKVKNSAERKLDTWTNYGLRRFSGFVDYETNFDLPQGASSLTLNLGRVQHMAEVWINDKKAGERLWPPFRFTIKENIKKGKNKLVVRIGNLMVNKMGYYDDLEKLRTWGWEGTPPDSCFNAGLYGPVKIAFKK